MFLGDIWSEQNSKTFELCLSVCPSVRPSVVNMIASEHKELQTWKFARRLLQGGIQKFQDFIKKQKIGFL